MGFFSEASFPWCEVDRELRNPMARLFREDATGCINALEIPKCLAEMRTITQQVD